MKTHIMRWAPKDWRPHGRMGHCVAIYVLVDPYTMQPFYVGQASNPPRRFRQHMGRACHSGRLAERIRSCAPAPEMGILEWCELFEAEQREQYWIDKATAMGCRLVNGARVGGQ